MPKKILFLTAVFILLFGVLTTGCSNASGSAKNTDQAEAVTTPAVIESASTPAAAKSETTQAVSVTEGTPDAADEPEETGEEASVSSEEQSESVTSEEASVDRSSAEITVTEDGTYSDKEHVALYIHTYGHLPDNYITKREAEDAGWENRLGNLWDVCPGMSIGGDKFGNYEGLLPNASGRKYYECDIDYEADYDPDTRDYRGEKRIIYSSDGLVYYTEDHYESFELLYGEP